MLHSEPLRHPEVAPLVLVGLAVERPLESNFFPGLLEGLLGNLNITAAGGSNSPSSSHEGVGHAWSTAVGEAILWIKQKEVKVPETVRLPPSLDPVYQEDPRKRRRDLIPSPLTDPLSSPSMARVVFEAVRPPVVLKAFPLASTREAALTPLGPKGGESRPEASKQEEHTPGTSLSSLQVPGQSSIASDTDSGQAKETTSEEVPPP